MPKPPHLRTYSDPCARCTYCQHLERIGNTLHCKRYNVTVEWRNVCDDFIEDKELAKGCTRSP